MHRHKTEISVRYEETDQMGVAYYANYLVWFEVARTEFFKSKGLDYRMIEEKDRIYLPVVEAYCRYRHPVKYDDVVTVFTELTDIGTTRLGFAYEVKRDNKTIATGSTKHAFVNKEGTPIPIPSRIKHDLAR